MKLYLSFSSSCFVSPPLELPFNFLLIFIIHSAYQVLSLSLLAGSFITLSKFVLKQTSNTAASNLGRDKQLVAITSLDLCAKATLISLIMNNGGGNREACLWKFLRAVISFMLNSQNSGGASENNPPPSFSPLNRLTCFYFPLLLLSLSVCLSYFSSALLVFLIPQEV